MSAGLVTRSEAVETLSGSGTRPQSSPGSNRRRLPRPSCLKELVSQRRRARSFGLARKAGRSIRADLTGSAATSGRKSIEVPTKFQASWWRWLLTRCATFSPRTVTLRKKGS
jgi:hypothetical protein